MVQRRLTRGGVWGHGPPWFHTGKSETEGQEPALAINARKPPTSPPASAPVLQCPWQPRSLWLRVWRAKAGPPSHILALLTFPAPSPSSEFQASFKGWLSPFTVSLHFPSVGTKARELRHTPFNAKVMELLLPLQYRAGWSPILADIPSTQGSGAGEGKAWVSCVAGKRTTESKSRYHPALKGVGIAFKVLIHLNKKGSSMGKESVKEQIHVCV